MLVKQKGTEGASVLSITLLISQQLGLAASVAGYSFGSHSRLGFAPRPYPLSRSATGQAPAADSEMPIGLPAADVGPPLTFMRSSAHSMPLIVALLDSGNRLYLKYVFCNQKTGHNKSMLIIIRRTGYGRNGNDNSCNSCAYRISSLPLGQERRLKSVCVIPKRVIHS